MQYIIGSARFKVAFKMSVIMLVFMGLLGTWLYAPSDPFTPPVVAMPLAEQANAPSRTTGGPDNFGYQFIDSLEPNGPQFNWIDITNSGTPVTNWTDTDNGYSNPLPIGFTFNYYGHPYTQVYAGTNGYISFGQGFSTIPIPSLPLPGPATPQNEIALFGGDLYYFPTLTAVHYQTLANPARFVLQYNRIYDCCWTNTPRDFEVILYPNGEILVQYLHLYGTSSNYVGIENETGTDGLAYPVSLSDSLAIAYVPAHIAWEPRSQTGTGQPGEVVTYTGTLYNNTDQTDTFTLNVNNPLWNTTLSTPSIGPLAAGDSATVVISVTIPLTLNVTTVDTAVITATSATNPTEFLDALYLQTTGLIAPQIEVSPNALSATLLVGETETQTLTVTNSGTLTLTYNITETNREASFQSWMAQTGRSLDGSIILVDSAHGQSNLGLSSALRANLEAAGATIIYHNSGPITPVVLQNATVLWVNTSGTGSWSSGELQTIQEWVLAGGGLFVENYSLTDLSPIANILGVGFGSDSVYAAVTTHILAHPTTQDVTTVQVGQMNHSLVISDTALAQPVVNVPYPGPNPELTHVSASQPQGGKGVVMSGYDFGNGFLSQEDNALLAQNIFEWLSTPTYVNLPWVSETPLMGSLPAQTNADVSVVFDATAVQPGQYLGNLLFRNNSPQENLSLPITLTVQPTVNMGWVEGLINDSSTGLPVQATVTAFGQPFAVTADETGYYKMWLDQGTYSIQVAANDYLSQTFSVNIVSQQGTENNLSLIPIRPALSYSPTAVTLAQQVGAITTTTLTLNDIGALPLHFVIEEDNGFFTPLPSLGMVTIPSIPSLPKPDVPARSTFLPHTPNPITIDLDKGLHASQNIRVLLAPAGEAYLAQAFLEAYPDLETVDIFDVSIGTPTLSQLAQYDVVIVWSNYEFFDPDLLGDHLADYIDQGGKVIMSAFAWYGGGNSIGGRFSFDAYSPLASLNLGNHYSDASLGTYQPLHPIMRGITAISDYHRDYVTLSPGAELIASWDDDEEFVATKENVIAINSYFGDNPFWAGDIPTLVHNSIIYLVGGGEIPWLSETPISGTIESLTTMPIDLTWDGTGQQPGTHTAHLKVFSDDPLQYLVSIPLTMTLSATAVMGQVQGVVTDLWTQQPITATANLEGVYAASATPEFSIWANEGTYTLTVSAEGYLTQTMPVTITAGGVITQDVALELAVPHVNNLPSEVMVTAVAGATAQYTFNISNTGPIPLEFAWHEFAPNTSANGLAPNNLAGIKILYDLSHGGYDTGYHTTLVNNLLMAGALITQTSAIPATVITSDLLQDYDILWLNCCSTDNWTSSELSAVQNWLAQGGAIFAEDRFGNTADVLELFDVSVIDSSGGGVYTNIQPHPVTAGVDGIYCDYSYRAYEVPDPSSVLVYDSLNRPHVIAINLFTGGKLAAESANDFIDAYIDYEDNRLIVMNMFNWLAAPGYGDTPWLSENPESGLVSSHAFAEQTLDFDATALPVGTYQTTLVLDSNDPAHVLPIEIPVTLQVISPTEAVSLQVTDNALTVTTGSTAVYTAVVTNEGDALATFDLNVQGSWLSTPSVSQTPALSVGESYTFVVSVTVPLSAMGGEQDVAQITATAQGNSTVNASQTVTTTALSQAGLELHAQANSLNGQPGNTVLYTLTLTNTGNITDSFALSSSDLWGGSLSVSQTGSLAPGQITTFTFMVSIPLTATNGLSDTATVTAVSQFDTAVQNSLSLTTVAQTIQEWVIFLPIGSRSTP